MDIAGHKRTQEKFDKYVAITGALLPFGIMLGPSAFEAIIALTSLIWIAAQIKFKNNSLKTLLEQPFIKPLIAVYISILISVLLNGGGDKGYLHDVVIIRHLLFIAAMVETSQRFPVFRYLFYGIVAGFVYALLNIAFVHIFGFDFMGKPLTRYLEKEKEGVRYPTMLAFYTLFFLTWALFDTTQKNKVRALISIAAITGLCFLTSFHIRTLHLALLSSILFVLFYFMLKKKNYLLILCGIASLTGISYYLYTTNNFRNLASVYERIFIWKTSFLLFYDNPLFGAGISSYMSAITELIQKSDIKPYIDPNGIQWYLKKDIYHAHNNFLQILSCTGIIGLICSLWLSVVVLQSTFKNITSHYIGFISWPILYFVISLAGFSLYTGWYLALASFIIVCVSTKNLTPH
ncbi:MAG: O-antigen ligase family protein [Proteobacteria bacterium]|nr:O-antigen ligase family protein [Pseudomonadota bacterium]MBU1696406.1 O-antigen ligase family protein [Pseudomonadota bacterium]